MDSGLGGDISAGLERAPAGWLDERGRSRPGYPSRPRSLRRGIWQRPDPPRLSGDGPPFEWLRLPGLAPRRVDQRCPSHGSAAAAEGVEGHLRIPRTAATHFPGDADVWP